MKLIELSYSGHYPSKFITVTDEEWKTIQRLEKNQYLFDTIEGQDLIEELSKRKAATEIPQVIAYV